MFVALCVFTRLEDQAEDGCWGRDGDHRTNACECKQRGTPNLSTKNLPAKIC